MYKTLGELQNDVKRKKIPEYYPKQDINYNAPSNNHQHYRENMTPVYKKKETGKKLWGPPLWFSLHFGALNLPDKLTPDDQSMVVNFLKSLPIWIACDECKNHAYNYIQKNTYRLMSMSKSKEGVFQFLWEFHNHVNRETGKGEISLEEAYYIYTQHPESSFK